MGDFSTNRIQCCAIQQSRFTPNASDFRYRNQIHWWRISTQSAVDAQSETNGIDAWSSIWYVQFIAREYLVLLAEADQPADYQ